MRAWLVPAAFGALAVPIGVRAAEAVIEALAHLDARLGLVALYFLLRMGVGIAFAAFTLRRSEPHRRSREPPAIAACAMAMLVVLPIGGPGSGTATGLVLAGDLIAVVACAWLLISVLALGRCFGVLPEARGLVTRGPYRIVRHPVYLGEIGALSGLTVASPRAWTVVFLAVFCATQLVRMRLEERALTAAFPEYCWYASRTRRLLPRFRPSS